MKSPKESSAVKTQAIEIGGVVFVFSYHADEYYDLYESDENLYFLFNNIVYQTNFLRHKYLEGGFTAPLNNKILGSNRDLYSETFIENIQFASKHLNELKKILLLQ